MSTPPKDDDERRLRSRLRRLVDGPPPEPEQPSPLVQVRYIPPPTAAPAADDEDQEPEDDEPEQHRPWWQLAPGPFRTLAPEPAPAPPETEMAPGLYVTVNQPEPAAAPPWLVPDPAAERAAERLHRLRIWVAYHLTAGITGWVFGLVGLMYDVLVDAGQQGAAVGIAIGFVGWIVASYLPGLPYMPPALRPALIWAARIPVSSAAIALALYAPGTV
ncbi:hypothetical protein SFUL_3698 [Streptomyces microflavus DSM 40593]|uniref:Uncharacterized protein n=1 Tax=Streptomyces microflavus DSM 40593 TaxID=1303692 RepID=N0CR16_STRMI|nr:hypothetical protein [Streptomyces microflavus]AGK78616.1 hypothetical protein SFUL_3698 [Streptomyces microflavus DSM 40593]